MQAVAIVGGGPVDHIPDLKEYEDEIDLWIGADGGALKLAESGITIGYAVGDFDSIDETQNAMINDNTTNFDEHTVTFPLLKNLKVRLTSGLVQMGALGR